MHMKVLSSLALVATAACVTACIYEDDPPRDLRGDDSSVSTPGATSSSGYVGASSSSSSGDVGDGGTASTSAMLVEVDTDQTMNAVGGEGVGVFVEYAKGGHWHVWWTCDTNQTQQSCNFSVSMTAATGNISNIDASQLGDGLYTSPSTSRLDTTSTTTTDVKGVKFDTSAGAVITVEAALGSVEDGSFLFFVEDGKVNGGFTGKLTNPLRFQGSTP